MRRKDKEITSLTEIEAIIRCAQVCRLAMVDGTEPYVVPLNFGYSKQRLYFHSAREGRKVDVLRRNNRVCFEFDIDHQVVSAPKGCEWGFRYQSVIGTGSAFFIEEIQAKKEALDIIMRQYSEAAFDYADDRIQKIVVIGVAIDTLTGKRS